MDEQTKLNIIIYNEQFRIKTKFFSDDSILSYYDNGTIYINESIEQDYEQTNLNEVMHALDETEGFKKFREEVLAEHQHEMDEIVKECEMRYYGAFSEDEIRAGAVNTDIALDLITKNEEIVLENGLNSQEELVKGIHKKITGQDLGHACYDTDVELCDDEQHEMDELLRKQKDDDLCL